MVRRGPLRHFKVYTKQTDEGFDRKRTQGIGTGERILRTVERPAHVAKNRLGLPEEMPLDWDAYAQHLTNGTAARAAGRQEQRSEVIMANLNGFDANTVDPASDFEPLPAGKYLAVITASEMKPTKSGNGHYLELTFQVIDGPYKGRMLWSRLNLDNPNRPGGPDRPGGALGHLPRGGGHAAQGLARAPRPAAPGHGEVQEARGHRGHRERDQGATRRRRRRPARPSRSRPSTPPWARR